MPVTVTVATAGEGSSSLSGLAQREMIRRQDAVAGVCFFVVLSVLFGVFRRGGFVEFFFGSVLGGESELTEVLFVSPGVTV